MLTLKMPRWGKNAPILHDQLNRLAEGVEVAGRLDVDTSTGLQISRSAAGTTIGLASRPSAIYAIVSSGGITAATTVGTVTTLGKGQIDRCYKDDAGVLQFYGGPSEDCYNSTNATASKGDVIQAKWVDEDWAWDVASCD